MTPTDTLMHQLAAERAHRAELHRDLAKMTPAERQAAMHNGTLTPAQLWEWARHQPDEVPLINGEWAFIAAHTPEVAEAPTDRR
jgi:hypothetical protein